MEKLFTLDAVAEQLALGNKLHSFQRIIEVDLDSKTKTEKVVATVDKFMLAVDLSDLPYKDAADEWMNTYLESFTRIEIKGRYGRFATLPYSQKDTLMPQIIKLFNN